MFSAIWSFLKNATASFWNAVKRLWRAVVNFFKNVVEYFRKLRLDRNKHKPFIADLTQLKPKIKNAPVRNVGIFEGVYNEETDEIEHAQIIEADRLDDKTKDILDNDPLVILS
ncbi:MAG: hypothetical protein K2J27_09115 [Duncaniella sp.]|nr:hypothetical protein [Duncaniella sp.]